MEQSREEKTMTWWVSLAPYFLAILRIVAAAIFFMGGVMKVFGFPIEIIPGGGTVPLMTQGGIGSVLEVICGAFLLIGLFTRPMAFLMSGMMAIAYFQFHAPQSFWPQVNMGIPAILYCFIWLYFSATGAGPWSIDRWRERGSSPTSG
jgi:putative oxidoreductase